MYNLLETEERECLLLDEYAGCTTEDIDPSCSSGPVEMTTAEVGDVASDVEASDGELSSGDDSTDIDAVVKEYRDRIQVCGFYWQSLVLGEAKQGFFIDTGIMLTTLILK